MGPEVLEFFNETLAGQEDVRVAVADKMVAEGCVRLDNLLDSYKIFRYPLRKRRF